MFIPFIFSYFYHFISQDLMKNWACNYFVVEPNISCDGKQPTLNFPQYKNASSSLFKLLSHLPPPQMHLFTWFFLLWPLATLYYHLGLSNSLLHHWGHYKSSNTAVSLTALPYHHCWSILSLILYTSCEILISSWSFSIDDLNLASFEGFSLAQGMF